MAHTPRRTFIRYTFSTPHWCNEIINQSYGSSSMHQANRHGQDYLLKINSSMRSWQKSDLSGFARGQAGLSISETIDLLGSSHKTISTVYRGWSKKTKYRVSGRDCWCQRSEETGQTFSRQEKKTLVTAKVAKRLWMHNMSNLEAAEEHSGCHSCQETKAPMHISSPKLHSRRLEKSACCDESRVLLRHWWWSMMIGWAT